MLAPYQVEHLVLVLATYRNKLVKDLKRHFISKAQRQWLQEQLTTTDEIADSLNVLELDIDIR